MATGKQPNCSKMLNRWPWINQSMWLRCMSYSGREMRGKGLTQDHLEHGEEYTDKKINDEISAFLRYRVSFRCVAIVNLKLNSPPSGQR